MHSLARWGGLALGGMGRAARLTVEGDDRAQQSTPCSEEWIRLSASADLLAFAGADHVLQGEQVQADAAAVAGRYARGGRCGAGAPGGDAILVAARAMGSDAEARLIGSSEHLPAPAAAFVNGYRIHCLEWDAVHEPAVVHALSTVGGSARRGDRPARGMRCGSGAGSARW